MVLGFGVLMFEEASFGQENKKLLLETAILFSTMPIWIWGVLAMMFSVL